MIRHDDFMEVPDGWGFAAIITRRDFLALTATGLVVMVALERFLAGQEPVRLPQGRQGYPPTSMPTSTWARMAVDLPRRQDRMGQGAMTCCRSWLPRSSKCRSPRHRDGRYRLPWDMGTFGSLSIRQFGPILRTAAAEARSALLQLASEKLQVPVAVLRADSGRIVHATSPRTRVTYGELTAGKRIERQVTTPATLDAVASFTVVGRSVPRRDALDKVTGKARFAGDIVPGALQANPAAAGPRRHAVVGRLGSRSASGVPSCATVTSWPSCTRTATRRRRPRW
jgi:hypothetical protein